MRAQTKGTVNRGQLQLDEPLDLPDQSRVQVIVELNEDWRTRYRSGLEEFKRLIHERPIHAGIRFTREELHERG
jgi:hypothetical protein